MNELMISKEGDISLSLKSKDVTWFHFLQYSRVNNSLNGGWNSKSFWVKNGLKILVDANFAAKWTENSINTENPTPRKKDFMLNRVISANRETILNKDTKEIDDLSENDINTVLFFSNNNPFPDFNIIGYETPLVGEKDGQLKIDLLGFNTKNESIGIIELKQSSSPSNSPLMALVELFCYGIQLLKCKTEISKEMIQAKSLPIDGNYFNKIDLIIAAPEAYWKYWDFEDFKKNEIKDDFHKLLEIINPVMKEVTNSLFSLEFYKINNDFSTELI